MLEAKQKTASTNYLSFEGLDVRTRYLRITASFTDHPHYKSVFQAIVNVAKSIIIPSVSGTPLVTTETWELKNMEKQFSPAKKETLTGSTIKAFNKVKVDKARTLYM